MIQGFRKIVWTNVEKEHCLLPVNRK